MKISIAQRLRPFSHRPGASCLLPWTSYIVQAFPARLRIIAAADLATLYDMSMSIQGPLDNFTICQDLEDGFVKVLGKTQTGFMRFCVKLSQAGKIDVICERLPEGKLAVLQAGHMAHAQAGSLRQGDVLTLECASIPAIGAAPVERLSFGSHKAQDMDQMRKRLGLKELLPLLYRLAAFVPAEAVGDGRMDCANAPLLDACAEAVRTGDAGAFEQSFQNLFMAGFGSMLVPRSYDEEFQGITPPPDNPEQLPVYPLELLVRGAKILRDSIIRVEGDALELPLLPARVLHCGRLCSVQAGKWGVLDVEWAKKNVKKIIFKADNSGELRLVLQKGLQSFRLRRKGSATVEKMVCPARLQVERGETYYFDRFQK